jgi:gas vesicle protein
MFSRVRIAIRFFFFGLAVGVLLAPRSGEETRRMVRAKADRLLGDILEAATLGTTYESSNGADAATDDGDDAPKRATRSRSRAATTTGAATEG